MVTLSRQTIAVAWALQVRGIPPAAWKVLMVMAHMVNNRRGDFDVWPSHRRLAEECDMPVSTLKRQLDLLDNEKLIVRSQRFRNDGGKSSCTYTLNVKAKFAMHGRSIDVDFEADDSDEPIAHIELSPQPAGGPSPQPASELSEYKKKEPLKKELSLFDAGASSGVELPDITDLVAKKWNDAADKHPGVQKARLPLDDARKQAIRNRSTRTEPGQSIHQLWDQFFDRIEASEFLQGRAPPGHNRREPFKLSMTWALKSANFNEIMEGKYGDRHANRTTHTAGGRRLGPAEQAAAGALARFLPAGERRDRG